MGKHRDQSCGQHTMQVRFVYEEAESAQVIVLQIQHYL